MVVVIEYIYNLGKENNMYNLVNNFLKNVTSIRSNLVVLKNAVENMETIDFTHIDDCLSDILIKTEKVINECENVELNLF